MKKPQGYLYLAAANPADEIGVSNLVSGHTANNAVFLCPKKHGNPFMGGLCGAAQAAPLLTSGTPTRTVPSTLIGVRRADISTLVRECPMQNNTPLNNQDGSLCARDSRTIQRAITILEKSFSRADTQAFHSADLVGSYARLRLGRLEHEEFHAFWLDSQNHLIATQVLSIGTIDRAEIHLREVAKSALLNNAAAVIFAHNHPSGNCTPSSSDIRLTKSLKSTLKLFDVRVLDHIVVSPLSFTSMLSEGMIND